jgi:hypothetical protein
MYCIKTLGQMGVAIPGDLIALSSSHGTCSLQATWRLIKWPAFDRCAAAMTDLYATSCARPQIAIDLPAFSLRA